MKHQTIRCRQYSTSFKVLVHATVRMCFFYASLFSVVFPLFAELTQKIDLTVSARTGYSSMPVRNNEDGVSGEDSKYWHIGGESRFSYTLSGKNPQIRGLTRIALLGTEQNKLLLELSRAYIRARIPFNIGYSIQLELGKNTLAWGEGSYYNAGDVIFGSDPKSSTLQNSSFRDYAFWQLRMFIPINSFSYFEPVFGLPDQQYTFDSSNNVSIASPITLDNVGTGARFHVETGILQWELGAYSRFIQKQVSPYISLAIPLTVRIYIASSTTLDYRENTDPISVQLGKQTAISGGLLYIFGFDNGGNFTFQPEILYKSFMSTSDSQFAVQLNMLWKITRVLGLVFRSNMSFENQEYSLLLGPQWSPVTGFTLSALSTTLMNIENQTDNNTFYSGLDITLNYIY